MFYIVLLELISVALFFLRSRLLRAVSTFGKILGTSITVTSALKSAVLHTPDTVYKKKKTGSNCRPAVQSIAVQSPKSADCCLFGAAPLLREYDEYYLVEVLV